MWFVVPTDQAEVMGATLIDLRAEVTAAGFAAGEATPMGIAVKEDGVYLGLSVPVPGCAPPAALVPERRVIATEQGQDPRPLYVVPWVPGAPNEALDAFKEKVRSRVQAWIGHAPLGASTTLAYVDLLAQVSHGVYALWRDRDALRGRVLVQLQGLLAEALAATVESSCGATA